MAFIGNLQQLGRAVMLPMIILPAAAVFQSLAQLPWDHIGLPGMTTYLEIASTAIFQFLPYIFAIGIALGLTSNGLGAGMAALVGMFIYTGITAKFAPETEPTVLIGTFIGIVAGVSHLRFKDLRLPEYIQFFGGPRFVPLFVSFFTLIFSMFIVNLSEQLEWLLIELGEVVSLAGGFGVFLYGFIHRILVIFGLHHLVSHLFWFQVGGYETEQGYMVYGDLPRFFAGDPTAGSFMAGLYPTMMFALPAIAFAIIHEAREDLKPQIRRTFTLAALSSFLTGVTEPVEFAFLFVAPYLYVVHALLSGLIMWITSELGILHGFSFSAGAIDYIINMHLATNGWLIIPIGIVTGIVYYFLFRWAIRRFQIPTPGREEGSQLDEWVGDIPYRAPLILQAIGGKKNIVQMESCITRLRLKVHSEKDMDINALRNLGAAGVIRLGGGHVQVVFGTYSELIREEMLKTIHRDQQQISFHSPMQGRMIPLSDVPDPIFSAQLVGNGVAFIPDRGELVSPVKGKVMHIYPTMHAIGLLTDEGLEVLLHIGIDTSKLVGKDYFTAVVKEGEEVEPGQLLIRFNLHKVKKDSKSLATPMVITNSDRVKAWRFSPFMAVKKGQSSIMSVVLEDSKNEGGSTMIQGIGASSGIAIGKAFVLPNWELEVPEQRIDVADFAREFERVYEGIKTSKDEIKQIKDELKDTVGIEETQIFDAHLAILDDPIFMNEIQGIIQRQYKAAEVAVKEAVDHFVTMFDLLEDDYMKERALDIRDVGNRLLKHLLGVPEIQLPSDNQPFILIAKEVSPSQLAHLNPEHVLGIVTLTGSTTSHSAIMARALGIPLIVGVEGKITESLVTGQSMIMDGSDGSIYVEPTEHIVELYRQLQEQQREAKEMLQHLAGYRSVTADGKYVRLEANISSLKELEIALKGGAQGVGLFRTEFLYMDRMHFPSEEEQYSVYAKVAEQLKENSVVIRTLDIGGDKHLDYYEIDEEQNPFMGYRAIRISLDQKELFKTQLRAILRASVHGQIKIMYPFITSVNEVRAAKAVLEEAKQELRAEGIPFDEHIPEGCMIEVPAAVLIADALAKEVDFFSIGTNDLIQFTLAVDRMNERISQMYEPYHPSVIKMLSIIVEAAKRNHLPVGVCGELAGDIRALPIWLSLGVDSLSMSAHSILPLKSRLIYASQEECKDIYAEVLECVTSEEIKASLDQYMEIFDLTANG